MFHDVNTKIPVDDSGNHDKAADPDSVYMDAMGFGMGCCCLQLTFQACCITEARTLYDQLAPLCPIMVSSNYIILLPKWWSWAGHLVRCSDVRLAKAVYELRQRTGKRRLIQYLGRFAIIPIIVVNLVSFLPTLQYGS